MARIAFIQKISWDFIGVMSLSAMLKKHGHQCDVFIENEEKNLAQKVSEYNPDIAAFSVVTNSYQWSLREAGKIKKTSNAKIIFGGIHPTIFPETINNAEVDIICRGEGEGALLDLANSIDEGRDYCNISNLWVKKSGEIIKNTMRPRIVNLDDIPILDRDLYYKYRSLLTDPVRNAMVTRGCPYPCTFCFNHQVNKLYEGQPVIRRRSVEGAIKEVEQLKKYRTRCIFFCDDTFTIDRNWLYPFLKLYKERIGIPFFVNVRVEHLDEDMIRHLKDAGVHTVDFGIETGNEERRKKMLKKNITNEQILKASALLKKYKININAENILGLPGETIETAWETFELNKKIKPTYAWCSLFQPYPELDITKEGIANGTIKMDMNAFDAGTFYVKSSMCMSNIDEISNLQKFFNVGIRLPRSVVKMLIKFRLDPLYLFIFLASYGFGVKNIFNLTYKDTFKKGWVMLKGYFKK